MHDIPQFPTRQCDTSMRRQLLRRIWSKEFRQSDTRSGSLSPPLRRSQRRLNADPVDKCAECSKLNLEYSMYGSLPEAVDKTHKRVRMISIASSLDEALFTNNYPAEANVRPSPYKSDSSLITTEQFDRFTSTGDSTNVTMSDTPFKDEEIQSNINLEDINDNIVTPDVDPNEKYSKLPSSNQLTIDSLIQNEPTMIAASVLKTEAQHTNQRKVEEENGSLINNNTNREQLVDQYIANLLIDSLNNIIANNKLEQIYPAINTQSESNIDDNQLSSGHSVAYFNDKTSNTQYGNHESTGNIEDIYSQMSTIRLPEFDQNQNETMDGNIYCPQYSADSKDNQSGYLSVITDKNQEFINVQSGSTYPDPDCVTLLPRLVHRTESMEVQRASSSPCNDDSDNSLVDSLDERSSSPEPDDLRPHNNELNVQYEKSQTFFVPIQESSQQTSSEPIDMAKAMPAKLREKLMKRLQTMDSKKHTINTPKPRKFKRKVQRNQKEIEVSSSDKIQTECKSVFGSSAKKGEMLQSDIRMLETYKIDARGNMQFQTPTNPANKCNTNKFRTQLLTSSSRSGSKTKRPIQNRRETLKRSQVKKSSISTCHRRSNDVQKLTIYQSDIITPDTECGPRRMYQKTEIQEGEKRIEILEIVECIDSSSSCESRMPVFNSFPPLKPSRRSKIPVPVLKTGLSGYKPKYSKCSSRESPGRIFVKNIQKIDGQPGNTKVDQMIADLLIEALNNPKELGIEFVKSPTEYLRKTTPKTPSDPTRVSNPKTSPNKSTDGLPNSSVGSRRLTSGSLKYHQVFDMIPEEKSSVSVNSSADELPPNMIKSDHEDTNREAVISKESGESCGHPASCSARGKEAVESESAAAWLGFFEQHENPHHEGMRILLLA